MTKQYASGTIFREPRARISAETDDEPDVDRAFFAAFPNRTDRLRRAHPAEVQEYLSASGAVLEPNVVLCIAVRQFRPGFRVRAFFLTDKDGPCLEEFPNRAAKLLFDRFTNPETVRRLASVARDTKKLGYA
jgi:hypothetical protein